MNEPTVGIVGLGLMGMNVADRLLDSGYSVVGYDTDVSALDAFVDAGGIRGSSPSTVAEQSEIVITSLPNPAVVEEVYLGPDGIETGAEDGTIACEMSTIDPVTTKHVAASLSAVDLLDTPVSGGPEDAARGTLMVLCGGEEAVYHSETVQDVLTTVGKRVFYAGPVGSGHTVKLLNNVMSAGNLLLAMEVVALGSAAGVEPETLNTILPTTGGSSKQLEKRLPRVLNRNFEPGFTVSHARKDLRLAVEFANGMDVPSHLGATILQFYTEAIAEGLEAQDMCSIVKLFEEHTNAPVESAEPVAEDFPGY